MNGMSSVMVTGSSGMIGTAVTKRLMDAGINVVGIDRRANRWSEPVEKVTNQVDLLEPGAASDLPAVDIVVHLAAHSRVKDLIDEPSLAVENVVMTSTILEYARDAGANLIFASSREVYGEPGQTVQSEGDAAINDAANPYGASKVGGESLVSAYSRCYEIGVTILRFSNVFGRFDVSDRVIPLFIARAHQGEDLDVYGEGKLLDFLYIDDCVDVIVSTVERFDAVRDEVVNVGSGRGHTLVELADMVASHVGEDVNINVEPNRTGEVERYVADIGRIHTLLGFDPHYSFKEGLDRTVEWYLDRPQLLDEILS